MRVIALVLAGQRERAVEVVDEIEKIVSRRWLLAALGQGTTKVHGAGYHVEFVQGFRRKEAETAKELKLGDIWEPTPFAAEVPKTERTKCAEPRFATKPGSAAHRDCWAIRPKVSVRFASRDTGCGAKAVDPCWFRLRAKQADERHRSYQDYVLAHAWRREFFSFLVTTTGWNPARSGATHQARLCSNQGVLCGRIRVSRLRLRSIRRGFRRARCAQDAVGKCIWWRRWPRDLVRLQRFQRPEKSIRDSRGDQANASHDL